MRIKNKKTYQLRSRITVNDDEGNSYEEWSEPVPIKANIYPASGKVQAEMYGERLKYISNMLYDGKIVINEGDGIWVEGGAKVTSNGIAITTYGGINIRAKTTLSEPDYKVISKKQYTNHQFLELESVL